MTHTILVVDDDRIIHGVLRHYLGNAGYQVITADSGREGLELAEQELPQLILLDVRMAELDGLTVLRRLKQTAATKDIPVIILTVSDDRLTQLDSELSGAAAFLTKPFSPAQLLAEVQRLLALQPPGSRS